MKELILASDALTQREYLWYRAMVGTEEALRRMLEEFVEHPDLRDEVFTLFLFVVEDVIQRLGEDRLPVQEN